MQPDLAGARIEALLFEGFVHHGQRVNSVNVVYLKANGVWNRLTLDAGTVHWRQERNEPRPWTVPEEGWDYPHSDAGSEYKLLGAQIASIQSNETTNGIAVEIRLCDGRRAVIQNAEDHTSFLLVPADVSQPSNQGPQRPGAA